MTESRPLYDSFIAEYYDASPMVAGRTQDVRFYAQVAGEFGGPVLELGCGTGRITVAVAQTGRRVVGLDISEKMLQRAAEKREVLGAEARERIRLVQGDMTRFRLGETFPCIIIPFRPFQHLTETREQIDCLKCARDHLAPGGRLILDVFQTDAERMHDPAFQKESLLTEYEMPGGRHVVLSERVAAFHRAQQCNDVEMIFRVTHPGGEEETLVMAWRLRYFFRYEVEHLLARCGFQTEALYGDFDGSPLQDASPEMIFVAGAA